MAISDKSRLILYDSDKISVKRRYFCHLLMLFQIIFVILCLKYDNLKQGKSTMFCDNMVQENLPKENGEVVAMQVPIIISASRSRKILVF